MKKFILFSFFFLIFPLNVSFSDEIPGFHFQNTEKFSDLKPAVFGFNNDMQNKLENDMNTLVINKYASDSSATPNIDAILKNLFVAETVLSILTITGYVANAVMGSIVLAEKFQNLPYLNGLLYAHIGVGLTGALLDLSVITLGFTTIGLQVKNNKDYNKAFAVSLYINTALYVTQLGLVAANLATSLVNYEASKWVGLAHGITSGAVMIGVSVQFGTSFIKTN